ncbi:hypothetical protein [Endozoicomonas sp.]|uniref:hypothetical protein n=1 Tax=Endozoicomonas sp. TaxID=1892382 RepID=UPI00383B3D04
MNIEPESCFIFAQFDNGDSIRTSINPSMSDDQIFAHYIGKSFSFARINKQGNFCEIQTKVTRLLITRENDSSCSGDELPAPPTSITIFEQEAIA